MKESVYDTENWQPLIQNKALLHNFVRPPTALETAQSRRVKPKQINNLEEMWKERPQADIKDLEVERVEKAQ
jgi:regulator of nonsense transcripts 1